MNADSEKNAIVAVYDTPVQSEDTIKELERAGFDMRKLSIVGKGFHSEEYPVGFYTAGDRMKTWGGVGAFWGGLWGMLFGAAFFWVPGIGPIAAAGPIVQLLVGGIEGAALFGGLSVLGAALIGMGIPRGSVVRYETELKADKYLVIAHGNAQEIEQARRIMENHQASTTEAIAA